MASGDVGGDSVLFAIQRFDQGGFESSCGITGGTSFYMMVRDSEDYANFGKQSGCDIVQ